MSSDCQPRKDYLSWEETFMRMAHLIKERSKDPSTQVGAVIVSNDNRVLSLGYNGTPNGYPDDEFPWGKHNDNPLENKYLYVVHAERNAILNYRGILRELSGATLYMTHYPCHECAKEIIQTGISNVIYDDEHNNEPATTIMFDKCGVTARKWSDFP